ncbi:MAG: class I SAM-dependent methyltransferase, partial [Bacillota bacterium]
MDEVEKYYDEKAEEEWNRLDRHKVEFDITKKYMNNYIEAKSKILDVGGGSGRYSIFLRKKGHKVTLFDLSKGNLELAQKKAKEKGVKLEDYIHGNALYLSDKVSGKFDVVLCMGPLYHFHQLNDREVPYTK